MCSFLDPKQNLRNKFFDFYASYSKVSNKRGGSNKRGDLLILRKYGTKFFAYMTNWTKTAISIVYNKENAKKLYFQLKFGSFLRFSCIIFYENPKFFRMLNKRGSTFIRDLRVLLNPLQASILQPIAKWL